MFRAGRPNNNRTAVIHVAEISDYQIATASILAEAADRKASTAVCLAVLRQVTPGYRKIVHNPTTYNYILDSAEMSIMQAVAGRNYWTGKIGTVFSNKTHSKYLQAGSFERLG